MYGYSDSSRQVEIVTLRVKAVVATRKPQRVPASRVKADAGPARIAAHRIFEQGRWRRAALYDRALLRPGDRLTGPVLIVELSATTYLPTGWSATVDGFSNLVLTTSKPRTTKQSKSKTSPGGPA